MIVGAAVAVALVVAGCIAVLMAVPEPEVIAAPTLPAVIEIEDEDLRYVYHLPTGQGSLYDLETDPKALHNLAHERPADVARLRGLLSDEHGVDDLESLRSQFQESIDALRRLGYL